MTPRIRFKFTIEVDDGLQRAPYENPPTPLAFVWAIEKRYVDAIVSGIKRLLRTDDAPGPA
jgi:hypothetical protein